MQTAEEWGDYLFNRLIVKINILYIRNLDDFKDNKIIDNQPKKYVRINLFLNLKENQIIFIIEEGRRINNENACRK
jgi:hypothetical protein